MHIIIGGTGQVGGAAAEALLQQGEPVTVVTRSDDKAAEWRGRGAATAVADLLDTGALRNVLRTGKRLFVVNPPGDPATDSEAAELRTVRAILDAIDGSGLERIVAQSTYGATEGTAIGDLGTLHTLEQGLAAQPIPTSIQRGAYFFSNWAMAVEPAREHGVLPSFFPADLVLPMVAPQDLGRSAAELLLASETGVLRFAEGPRRYTPADVAAAFARALGKPVEVAVTPPEEQEAAYRSFGFSPASAKSFAGMTRLATETPPPDAGTVWRGPTTLERYVAALLGG